MQSAVPHVLATLDRTHDPAAVGRAVAAGRIAGLEVSLDLIYGVPGESLADWRSSLDAALALEPDHVSAYALVVEEGTRLAGQVRRGEVAAPDDDDEAAKYELADEVLTAAGLSWYEVSNWLARPAHAADTTWATGPGRTGGGPVRAHTATSAASVGGMSNTPARMPPASAPRAARR